MQVRPVDPRDTRWEDDHPVFRVTFFDRPPAPAMSAASDEWEVRDADLDEVAAWAPQRARETGRTWMLHLLVDTRAVGRGLIRLRGSDPNAGEWVVVDDL